MAASLWIDLDSCIHQPPHHRHRSATGRRLPQRAVGYRNDKPIRGKVVYLQPLVERWREECAEVPIKMGDNYASSYTGPLQSLPGTLFVYDFISDGDLWCFRGTFTRPQASKEQVP